MKSDEVLAIVGLSCFLIYAGMFIFTFGYVANRETQKNAIAGMYMPEAPAAMAGAASATIWPLYWSWRLQEME